MLPRSRICEPEARKEPRRSIETTWVELRGRDDLRAASLGYIAHGECNMRSHLRANGIFRSIRGEPSRSRKRLPRSKHFRITSSAPLLLITELKRKLKQFTIPFCSMKYSDRVALPWEKWNRNGTCSWVNKRREGIALILIFIHIASGVEVDMTGTRGFYYLVSSFAVPPAIRLGKSLGR